MGQETRQGVASVGQGTQMRLTSLHWEMWPGLTFLDLGTQSGLTSLVLRKPPEQISGALETQISEAWGKQLVQIWGVQEKGQVCMTQGKGQVSVAPM